MDKISAIKIKQPNGSYSDQIPISVLVQNVQWDQNHSLLDALGSVDISPSGKGNLQHQIDELDEDKISHNDFNSQLDNFLSQQIREDTESWLEENVNTGQTIGLTTNLTISGLAADAKAVGDAIDAKTFPIDSTLSDSSTNPVQNKVVTSAISELNGSLDTVVNIDESVNIPTTVYQTNKAIRVATAVIYDVEGMYVTRPINVSNIESFTYKRMTVNLSNDPSHGFVFYNSSMQRIGGGLTGLGRGRQNGYVDQTVIVPEGAYYARFTAWSNEETYGAFAVWTDSPFRKNLSEAIKDEMSDIIPDRTISLNWQQGIFNRVTGEEYDSETEIRTSEYLSDDIEKVSCENDYKFLIYAWNGSTYIGRLMANGTYGTDSTRYFLTDWTVDHNLGYSYKIAVLNADESAISPSAGVNLKAYLFTASAFAKNIESIVEDSISDMLPNIEKENNLVWSLGLNAIPQKTNGAYNLVARMRMLTDIEYTPKKNIPRFRIVNNEWIDDVLPAGTKVKGIPYGGQLTYELWAGRAVGFDTFLSAIENPNSVIYNFGRVGAQYHGSAWYSINCSKAVSFALGLKHTYASGQFSEDPNISDIKSIDRATPDEFRVGDIIEKSGTHTAIITDIVYNTFGNVSKIEVSEAVTPTCRRRRWNVSGYKDNFYTVFAGYRIRRYALIDDIPPVDLETICPYISKTLGLNHGTNSNYLTGDTIKITLLDKVSDTLNVSLNGTALTPIDVTNYNVGDEITYTGTGTGFYVFNFAGGSWFDAVTCCKVDNNASLSESTLTFSSTTGTLVNVGYSTGGNRSHIGDEQPTSADLTNGYMTLTIPENTNHIHCHFANDYGVSIVEIAL